MLHVLHVYVCVLQNAREPASESASESRSRSKSRSKIKVVVTLPTRFPDPLWGRAAILLERLGHESSFI